MQKSEVRFVPPSPAPGQEEYYRSLKDNTITIATGLAGTGKTFLSLAVGMEMLLNSVKKGGIQKIVIIRPYMKTNIGEDVGALPGSLDEKVLPYIQAIKDNLRMLISNEQQISDLIRNYFEFTILSMCRGRSFNNCFVIVEEAQNVPLSGDAMLMLLTRIGKHSRMVIQGDMDQCDIPSQNSAMTEAINALQDTPGIGIIDMRDVETVQRSPMVRTVLTKYKEYRNENG